MASIQPELNEDLHFRLLKLLHEHPDFSQRKLANQLGISYGKMNYCLKALMANGLVSLQNQRHSNHLWRYAYVLTPEGLREKALLTSRFLSRKMVEYRALQAEIHALSAGMGQDDPWLSSEFKAMPAVAMDSGPR